jgi:hypothetical protein
LESVVSSSVPLYFVQLQGRAADNDLWLLAEQLAALNIAARLLEPKLALLEAHLS